MLLLVVYSCFSLPCVPSYTLFFLSSVVDFLALAHLSLIYSPTLFRYFPVRVVCSPLLFVLHPIPPSVWLVVSLLLVGEKEQEKGEERREVDKKTP